MSRRPCERRSKKGGSATTCEPLTENSKYAMNLKNRKLSKAGEKYMQKLDAKIKGRITKVICSDTYQLAHASTGEDLGVYNARNIYTRSYIYQRVRQIRMIGTCNTRSPQPR